jgi:hypothetical protein
VDLAIFVTQLLSLLGYLLPGLLKLSGSQILQRTPLLRIASKADLKVQKHTEAPRYLEERPVPEGRHGYPLLASHLKA